MLTISPLRQDMVAVAVAAALGLLIVAFPYEREIALAGPAAVGLIVAWICWSDLRNWIIPDGAIVAMAIIAVALRIAPLWSWADAMVDEMASVGLDAILCGGSLFAVREIYYRMRGVDGIGFGDVKLAAAGGMLCGSVMFSWALLSASLAGIIIALGAAVLAGNRKLEKLPFGALLAPACWLLWLAHA